MVRRGRLPEVAFAVEQRLVPDLVLRGIGANLILGQAGAGLVTQRAERDILQAMAGRADLGIDLQAALQLELVVGAERSLEGEGVVGDVDFAVTAAGLFRVTLFLLGESGRGGDGAGRPGLPAGWC